MGDSVGTLLDPTPNLRLPAEEPRDRTDPREGRPGRGGSWAVDYEEVE
jgi:hypothetical protein